MFDDGDDGFENVVLCFFFSWVLDEYLGEVVIYYWFFGGWFGFFYCRGCYRYRV